MREQQPLKAMYALYAALNIVRLLTIESVGKRSSRRKSQQKMMLIVLEIPKLELYAPSSGTHSFSILREGLWVATGCVNRGSWLKFLQVLTERKSVTTS